MAYILNIIVIKIYK